MKVILISVRHGICIGATKMANREWSKYEQMLADFHTISDIVNFNTEKLQREMNMKVL